MPNTSFWLRAGTRCSVMSTVCKLSLATNVWFVYRILDPICSSGILPQLKSFINQPTIEWEAIQNRLCDHISCKPNGERSKIGTQNLFDCTHHGLIDRSLSSRVGQ